jgi:poly-gamma-glutamate capsule biosynthesis protein CapA/YwtB (metallophosphatase superfamily)
MKLFSMLFIAILLLFLTLLGLSLFSPVSYPPVPIASVAVPPTSTPRIAYIPRPPTLDTIFSPSRDWVATLSAEQVRTIVATGDVLVARQVNIHVQESQDPNWPFEKTAPLLRDADIAFINLETPLISNCPLKNSGFQFCGEASNVQGLLYAGIDVVNIANNHASNYGREGVLETHAVLGSNGLLVSGINGPVYTTIRGITFAFVGYNEVNTQLGIAHVVPELIASEVAQAKNTADIVVVQFHWGVEYTHQPTRHQRELAHLAIDNGADLIIGNHPHWWQAVELYKEKMITYSHGNFVFDQMWSQETREGVVGRYTFYNNRLITAEFIPIIIYDYGQPQIAVDPVKRDTILSSMLHESRLLVQ